MPSIYNLNQAGPFWDFIANLEDQGPSHPFFNAYNPESNNADASRSAPPEHEGPPNHEGPEHHGPPRSPGWGGRRGGCGGGRRGPPGGFPGPHGPPHHGGHHRGGPHWGGPPHRGGWGGGSPPFNLESIAKFFQTQLGGETEEKDTSKDFAPAVDVFDTEDAYHVHVSLPGAKKEDVGVNYDAEKSELSIAGVVYRVGDEEFLKTLAMGERKVGVFDRKVRLGSRNNPAAVDADGITAKMEDGVLRVEIPKQDKEYVDVKKVDIE
ncbi:MAG: hypothetical protein M1812_002092 [Candelaria pacifica]|nr:MAG: hypothetical protein M1812_002092 [Candelaria pacifica]